MLQGFRDEGWRGGVALQKGREPLLEDPVLLRPSAHRHRVAELVLRGGKIHGGGPLDAVCAVVEGGQDAQIDREFPPADSLELCADGHNLVLAAGSDARVPAHRSLRMVPGMRPRKRRQLVDPFGAGPRQHHLVPLQLLPAVGVHGARLRHFRHSPGQLLRAGLHGGCVDGIAHGLFLVSRELRDSYDAPADTSEEAAGAGGAASGFPREASRVLVIAEPRLGLPPEVDAPAEEAGIRDGGRVGEASAQSDLVRVAIRGVHPRSHRAPVLQHLCSKPGRQVCHAPPRRDACVQGGLPRDGA
mmetsp:Transcript_14351/g.41218  ORF Transcript_14351/g.41218 Transcript_14351/m.41218 type:complete len:301 (-) Transcript_14351:695-1597(-)